MLFNLLRKRKRKAGDVVLDVVFCFFVWFFFVYIIYNFLFGLMSRYNMVGVYDHVNYDVVLNDVYADYYNSCEADDKYISTELKIRTGYENVYGDNGNVGYPTVSYIDSNSFDEFFSIISKKHFTDIDSDIVSSRDCVFISDSFARYINVKVGSTVEISGERKYVAGIYEAAIETILQSDVVTLWNGKYQDGADVSGIVKGELDYFAFYQKIFLKLNDEDKGTELLETEYFNHANFFNNIISALEYNQKAFNEYHAEYGDQWPIKAITDIQAGQPVLDIENVAKYKANYIFTKKQMHAFALQEYNAEYNVTDDTFYSGLCVVALFAVCILESYKHARANQHRVAVMRVLGYRRWSILIFYFLRSFIVQLLLMTGAIAFAKLMTNRSTNISFVLMWEWFIGFCIIIAVAALVSSLFSVYKLRDENLLKCLNEEK